jgi:hypothetical protein
MGCDKAIVIDVKLQTFRQICDGAVVTLAINISTDVLLTQDRCICGLPASSGIVNYKF